MEQILITIVCIRVYGDVPAGVFGTPLAVVLPHSDVSALVPS